MKGNKDSAYAKAFYACVKRMQARRMVAGVIVSMAMVIHAWLSDSFNTSGATLALVYVAVFAMVMEYSERVDAKAGVLFPAQVVGRDPPKRQEAPVEMVYLLTSPVMVGTLTVGAMRGFPLAHNNCNDSPLLLLSTEDGTYLGWVDMRNVSCAVPASTLDKDARTALCCIYDIRVKS